MKYVVPIQSYLYYLFTNDVSFENLIDQQVTLAEHGISPTESDKLSDLEREIFYTLIQKREKETAENRNAALSAFLKILT